MFTKWIPGIPKQLNIMGKQSTGTLTPQQLKYILQTIQNYLSEELGQKIQPQLSQSPQLMEKLTEPKIINSSLSSQIAQKSNPSLQQLLIASKQKYNGLVNQLDTHNQYMKQIRQHIVQLLINIGEKLQNEDLLTPIQDFQGAFQNLNPKKVQKTLTYFQKIFQAALDDFIKHKMLSLEKQLKAEMSVIKNYSKQIQILLKTQKAKVLEHQKSLSKLSTKNSQLSQKLKILQLTSSQHALQSYTKDLQKYKSKQLQYTQKIKNLERQKLRQQKINKQLELQIAKNNNTIETLKRNQATVIEQHQKQSRKKQNSYRNSINKYCQQKVQLQQKINNLNNLLETSQSEITDLQLQIQQNDNKNIKLNQQCTNNQNSKELLDKINDLKEQIQELQQNNKKLVNKQIIKELFLQFQDQSKEWAVRKDIQRQIYIHLGIAVSKPQQQQSVDVSQIKGWFNKFF